MRTAVVYRTHAKALKAEFEQANYGEPDEVQYLGQRQRPHPRRRKLDRFVGQRQRRHLNCCVCGAAGNRTREVTCRNTV